MADPIELIIAVYAEEARAQRVLKELQSSRKDVAAHVITGSILAKGIDGKTSVRGTLEDDRKRRSRYGALAGGLAGLLIGPAGVVVGAAAGAVAGRATSRKHDQNFVEKFLTGILDEMQPGSSALAGLVEQEWVGTLADSLSEFGGSVQHHLLADDDVADLLGLETATEAGAAEQTPASDDERAMYAGREAIIAQIKEMVHEGTRGGPGFERIHVIVNPASGKDQPILNQLNTVFHVADVDWDISITKESGDASRMAKAAAEAGADVVAAYGGDGTAMEAASGLVGTGVPLGILPGGTNNVLSVELGVPKDLIRAAALLAGAPAKLRTVDMGKCNEHIFILRVGVGFEGVINEGATRELKDRLGGMAYTVAGIKALRHPPVANYRLTMDGETVEIEGLTLMIANSANLGIPNVSMVQNIDVGDGLLDVIVVRNADLDSLLTVGASIADSKRVSRRLPHWQVREVTVEADQPQAVTGDGEIWEPTPLTASVIPAAVQIVVPDSASAG